MNRIALPALLVSFALSAAAQDPGLPVDVRTCETSSETRTIGAKADTPVPPTLQRVLALHDMLSELNFLWLSVPDAVRTGRAKILFHLAGVQRGWLDTLSVDRLNGKNMQRLLAAHDLVQELRSDFADGVIQATRLGKLPSAGLADRLQGVPTVTQFQPDEPEDRLRRVEVLLDLFDELVPALKVTTAVRHARLREGLKDAVRLQQRELNIVSGFALGPLGGPILARVEALRAKVALRYLSLRD